MDTKIDDLTGAQINKMDAWKVKLTNPATKLTIEIDCKPTDTMKTMIQTAISSGQRWFKWVQNENGSGVHKVYPDELGSQN